MRKMLLASALAAFGTMAAVAGSPDRLAPGCGSDWQCETMAPRFLVHPYGPAQSLPLDWEDDRVPPYGPDDGAAPAVDITRPFRRT